jgi:hypothetical protein
MVVVAKGIEKGFRSKFEDFHVLKLDMLVSSPSLAMGNLLEVLVITSGNLHTKKWLRHYSTGCGTRA